MAVSKELSRFTRDALAAGKSRDEIAAVLTASGWTAGEVGEALHAWSDTPFSPPVPRPQITVSARDFFVYALTFGVMITGAIYLVSLIHALIDLWMEADTFGRSSRIRWAISVLIVAVPVYLWLTLRDRAQLAADPALYRSGIRKWLTYLTLLLSAATLLGVLIAVIYAFLSGDFTLQFLLKALVVCLVAGLIFLFYLNDIRQGDAV